MKKEQNITNIKIFTDDLFMKLIPNKENNPYPI